MTSCSTIVPSDTTQAGPVAADLGTAAGPAPAPDDATCQCCGGVRRESVARQRGWTLLRCPDCGLVFVSPQPTAAQLSALYTQSAGYFATAEADLSTTSAEPATRLHRRLLAAGITGRRFLDVGCATGRLIYHMARLGWQVTGCDINPDAAAVARAHGLDVSKGALEELPFPDAFFDVIHMGDVLEHLPHPRQVLLTARRLLRHGGLLVLRTPNADCGFARATLRLSRWLGLPWAWSAAPYHLYEFSPEALSRMLEDTGFEVTQIGTQGRPALLYALGASGFFDGLKRRLKGGGRYRFDWRLIASLPKLIGVGLLLLPAFVYGAWADRRRRTGHRLLMSARRPSAAHEERPALIALRERGVGSVTPECDDGRRPDRRPLRAAGMVTGATHSASILGVTFDLLSDEQAFQRIESWRRRGERQYVTFSNPHSVMMSRRDEGLSRAFRQAGMTLPDGTGIVMAANLLGYPNHGRITGPSFMPACCDWGRRYGYRHYFCGGGEGVAESLAARLVSRYPGLEVAGTCSPPFRELSPDEDEALVARINAAGPDIVWVGLGAPKQERWMADHVGRIQAPAMIGVGAAFDFHAGRARRAPRWVRRSGIEWAYRLACEPRRMWRRNLDSPLFLLAVAVQWIRRLRRGRSTPASPAQLSRRWRTGGRR